VDRNKKGRGKYQQMALGEKFGKGKGCKSTRRKKEELGKTQDKMEAKKLNKCKMRRNEEENGARTQNRSIR
jgi:hypothetical protein